MIEMITFSQYREIQAINISSLKEMRKSPAHFKAKLEEPAKQTDDLLLGQAIHCLILQPQMFDSEFLEMPKIDRRTKDGKTKADILTAKALSTGLTLLPSELLGQAKETALRASQHPYFTFLSSKTSQAELTLTWEMENVACKGRLDHYDVRTKTITDIKTTKDASPDAFSQALYKYGYHNQASFYIEGAKANGLEVEDFIIFAIEKDPPYAIACYKLSDSTLAMAKAENTRWLKQYKQCKECNVFYGYPEEIKEISIPAWASKSYTEE